MPPAPFSPSERPLYPWVWLWVAPWKALISPPATPAMTAHSSLALPPPTPPLSPGWFPCTSSLLPFSVSLPPEFYLQGPPLACKGLYPGEDLLFHSHSPDGPVPHSTNSHGACSQLVYAAFQYARRSKHPATTVVRHLIPLLRFAPAPITRDLPHPPGVLHVCSRLPCPAPHLQRRIHPGLLPSE